jgi:hypothetical protein
MTINVMTLNKQIVKIKLMSPLTPSAYISCNISSLVLLPPLRSCSNCAAFASLRSPCEWRIVAGSARRKKEEGKKGRREEGKKEEKKKKNNCQQHHEKS